MIEHEVDRPMALDTFLRRKEMQAWRIPVLIDCGAIRILSEGRELPLKKGPKTHVDPGDKVRIEDPLSKKCQEALQKKVDRDWRDYAWVPGTTKFDKAMGKLIEARPATIRITDPSVTTFRQFLKLFESSPLVTHPIRSLIVGSHANDEGQLKIPFDSGTGKFVDWEDLEAAVKSKGFELKDEWFRPRPRDAQGRAITPYRLLVRGCRIGSERKFLAKLREALGRRIQVVAPRHFHAVDPHPKKPTGHVEYLAYSWSVHRPTALKSEDAVVKALMAVSRNTFIDGSPVAEKQWKEWVPRSPEAKYEQVEYTSVKSPIERKAVAIPRRFRYQARSWLPRDEPLAMDRARTTDAQRLEVLKPLLAKRPELQSTHPYPLYERLGYTSFEDFMKGWTWTFTPRNKPVDEVKFNAVRHEYTVILPVTEVASGELILNFFPSSKRDKVIELMLDDNPRLFETV
jgi:hypothetical protein